jgi:hypothetical protein
MERCQRLSRMGRHGFFPNISTYVALRSVKPCAHYDFVAGPETQQPVGHSRGSFDPCLWSAFVALAGCGGAIR